jgi:hypothetical protein
VLMRGADDDDDDGGDDDGEDCGDDDDGEDCDDDGDDASTSTLPSILPSTPFRFNVGAAAFTPWGATGR